MAVSVLILGGTELARQLALRLASDARYRPLLSFAGRTEKLVDPGVPYRVGGFGGVEGLVQHLQVEGYQALIDATHPFAAQMSDHAVRAAGRVPLPLLRLEVPPWTAQPGDRWTLVPDMHAAAAALGATPRRVFLSIGRQEVEAFEAAPQHEYLIRSLDAFTTRLPRARLLHERGPFDVEAERRLLVGAAIEILVSKNSGTEATYPKLRAARELGVPVVMVERPALAPALSVRDVEAAVRWLEAVHVASAFNQRGV